MDKNNHLFPTVSIITPLYNRVDLIGDTIQSVLHQTYSNWELLIVDDGSSDGSAEKVGGFCKEDARIKHFFRTRGPKGAPTCRNIGVELATGEYVIFLDSDDLLAPYCLQRRVEYLMQNPELDFAVSLMLMFKKTPLDSRILWNVHKENKDDLARFLVGDHPWQSSCPTWKKEGLRKFEPWDEEAVSWQDWEYPIKALSAKLNYDWIGDIPDCFVRRDDQEGISTKDKSKEQLISRKDLFIRILKHLDKDSDKARYYKKLLAGYFFLMAESIIKKNIDLNFKSYYRDVIVYNLLSAPVFYLSYAYLIFWQRIRNSRFKTLKKIILQRRNHLPDYLVNRKSDHLKLKLDKNTFEAVNYNFNSIRLK